MKPKKNKEASGFLNVDLDVYSRSNLEALAAVLARKTFVLHVGREGNHYGAHFELRAFPNNAGATIRGLTALIHALPRAASLGRRQDPRVQHRTTGSVGWEDYRSPPSAGNDS